MAKFQFSLDPLLKARRRAEQSRQRSVAELEQERLRLESSLRGQQSVIVENKRDLKSQLVGRLDVAMLRRHAAAMMQQARVAQRVVLELAGVHQRLEAARAELVEAAKARRAVELLRDRRMEQWKASIAKAETDALDELAVIKAARVRAQSPEAFA